MSTTCGYFPGYRVIGFTNPDNATRDEIIYSNNALRHCSVQNLQMTQSLYTPVDDQVYPMNLHTNITNHR
jgi:hypothetical protein